MTCPSQGSRRCSLPLVLGLATLGLGACQTVPPSVTVEDGADLQAAGFIASPADTPERQATLDGLPAYRFVQKNEGGRVSYLYADPRLCDCLYMGSQAAFEEYSRAQHDLRQSLTPRSGGSGWTAAYTTPASPPVRIDHPTDRL